MSHTRPWIRVAVVTLALALTAAACGSSDDETTPVDTAADDETAAADDTGTGDEAAADEEAAATPPTSGTLRVPEDYPTIQAAVDAAEPDSLILIAPGTYNEAVDVTTDRLVLRGLDRNTVVLDGQFELENGVRVLEAAGVVVENMTLRNYTRNGVFWTHVDGYRGSFLTAERNGDYGVYAFGSVNGQIDNSYGGGSPDAGFYIGQCYPCHAVIDNVLSEHNGIGYSGTNSGGDLYIVNSEWRFNRVGIVPNSGSYEGCAPERETTVVGNLVYSNTNTESPAIANALLAQGNGIVVSGGLDNVIERNRVWDHTISGIAIVPFPEDDPIGPIPEVAPEGCVEDAQPLPDEERAALPSPTLWPSTGNRVVGNDVSGSGEWDMVVIIDTAGNCFEDNVVEVTSPPDLQDVAGCDLAEIPTYGTDVGRFLEIIEEERPPGGDYTTYEFPPIGDLPGMDDPEGAPPVPQVGPPTYPDLDAIALPAAP